MNHIMTSDNIFLFKHIWNLHIEQELSGPVQCKMFLLKPSSDTDSFNILSNSFRGFVP